MSFAAFSTAGRTILRPTVLRLNSDVHTQPHLKPQKAPSDAHTSTLSSSQTETVPTKRKAFIAGAIFEAAASQVLNITRFNHQLNAQTTQPYQLKGSDYARCTPFFALARIAQLATMTEAKALGKDAAKNNNLSSPDLWGAAASSASGAPVAAISESILIKSVSAGHNQSPFQLWNTVAQTIKSAARFEIRGAGASIYRDLPLGACMVTLTPAVETSLNSLNNASQPNLATKTVSVAISALVFSLATQWADVVKTAIQSNPALPDSTLKVAKSMVAQNGYKSLLNGLTQRYPKVVGTFGIMNILVPKLESAFSNQGEL